MIKRWMGMAATAALALGCAGGQTATEPPPEDVTRVLFVGNSLTASWDLPDMVAALSAAAGADRPVWARAVVAGDYSLEDHWHSREATSRLVEHGWDLVVLQQGPSSLPSSGEHLTHWSRQFAPLIRAAGGVPALYMVWPPANRSFAFDAVRDHYRAAAQAVDGRFFPVGEAWRAAWRMDPGLELYDTDQFHPSRTAVFLAALVITAQIHDLDPRTLPDGLSGGTAPRVELPPGVAATLKAAAAEAIAAHGF